MSELTHVDEQGRASMVDVSEKGRTARRAVARGEVAMRAGVLQKIIEGDVPKGDVLQVARIAGVQAAKRTAGLIPLCHPLSLTDVKIDFNTDESAGKVEITAEVGAVDRTGVEMEALTAASVAALTIYDMCKALQKDMIVGPFVLMEKEGGKSGRYLRQDKS